MEHIDKNEFYQSAQEQGVSPKELESFTSQIDIEEIQTIVSACNSMEEALHKIAEKYTFIKYEDLKKNFDDYVANMQSGGDDRDNEEMVDLEDDALEDVAGGSIGSWIKKNWPGLVVGVAVTVAGTAIGQPMLGATLGMTAMNLTNSQYQKKLTPADAETDASHTF